MSLLVLTHEQRPLLDRAVRSAFAQDCPPIEIVLSDDGSSDGSFEQLNELARAGAGRHRVVVRPRQPNLGIAGHYNDLLHFAQGELLVTAAGDDESTPDRVSRLVAAWDATGRRADLIASHLVDMDAAGRLHGTIRVDDLAAWRDADAWFARRPYVVGAGHAFTRRLMTRFGPLRTDLAYEDQIMVFRAVCAGGAVTVDAPLVHYRRGGLSARQRFHSAQHMVDWKLRQLNRLRAEAEQLIADADQVGLGPPMRIHQEPQLRRDAFLGQLLAGSPWPQKWRAFAEAAPLPLGWRLRKLLDTAFPETTFQVKRALQAFRSR